jgi:hypothetical protein
MSQVEWYYARDNRQMGPVSAAELKRLAMFDELRPDDLVWKEGMTEWAAARNVRGLFEPEGGEIAAGVGGSAVRAGNPAAKAGTVAAKPQEPTAGRHLFDAIMNSFRSSFNAHFVEATAGVFRACGSYGLFVAAVLTAICCIVVASKVATLENLLWGAIWVLVLLALQYVAGKSFAAIDQLNRTIAGHLSSSLVPDCVAVLGVVFGIAALLGSIAAAVAAGNYLLIVAGVATFFVGAYVSVIALNWPMLNISIAPETLAGEECIGVLTFALKAILRLIPVAFGAGVLCGTVAMGFACYAAFAGEIKEGVPLVAAQAPAVAPVSVLLHSAALPLAAYLFSLFVNLVLNIWRAVLSLPGKLDVLAEKHDDEIGRGQPDTVTTHD